MNTDIDWLHEAAASPDASFEQRARMRQARLTKPAGSLGELEHLAIRLAGLQARERPAVDRVHVSIFAADHGVAREGVSAYPQDVTAQMIDNFAAGGAAISVLAHELGATLEVIDLGTVVPSRATSGVRRESLGPGTANLAVDAAMSAQQLRGALESGRAAVRRARASGAELFVGGEMGIGNTTSAAALASALLKRPARALTGPGTGIDAARLVHKQSVIEQALRLHASTTDDPLELLRRLGGFEIAALAGAFVCAAQERLPVLVDGFIAGVAALCAARLSPRLPAWLIHAHRSAEPGHAIVLGALEARPLLDLGMRLGEGSGAAVAVPLLRMACALHANMATFDGAGVSGRTQHG